MSQVPVIGGVKVSSMEFTDQWGVSPGSANLTIEADSGAAPTSEIALSSGGISLTGRVVSSRRSARGHSGDVWEVQVADHRWYLERGFVAAAYNIEVQAGGRRRWRHLLAQDWESGMWIETADPMKGREIIANVLQYADMGKSLGGSYGSGMGLPVIGLDYTSGTRPAEIVRRVAEELGMLVGLSGANTLRFEKRGGGGAPVVGAADQPGWAVGEAESGDPTKVIVVGGNNIYQVEQVELEKDWNAKWEPYWDEFLYMEKVKAMMPDFTEDRAGYAELAIRAREITVREWAAALGDADFLDRTPRERGTRADMPAWLYLREIVYRAYRVPLRLAVAGRRLADLAIARRLLCEVEVSESGELKFDTKNLYPEAQAVAAVRGQPIDVLNDALADLFVANAGRDWSKVWTRASGFEIDEEGKRVIFERPVIVPGDGEKGLFIKGNEGKGEAEELGDLAEVWVPNPDYKISAAQVRLSIAFEGERFSKSFGGGDSVDSRSAPGVSRHVLVGGSGSGAQAEIKFEDGRTAEEVAGDYAGGIGADKLPMGEVERFGAAGTPLTAAIQRRTIRITEGDGISETVSFARANPRRTPPPTTDAERQRGGAIEFSQAEKALKEEIRQLRLQKKLIAGGAKPAVPGSENVRQAGGVTRTELVGFSEARGTGAAYEEGQPVLVGKDGVATDDANEADLKLGGVATSANGKKALARVATAGVAPVRVAPPFSPGDAVGVDAGARVARVGGKFQIGTIHSASGYSGTEAFVYAPVRLGSGGAAAKARVPANTPTLERPRWVGGAPPDVPDGGIAVWFTLGTVNGAYAGNKSEAMILTADAYFYAEAELNGETTAPLAVRSWQILAEAEPREDDAREGYSGGSRPSKYWVPLGAALKNPDTGAWSLEPAVASGENGNILIRERVQNWAADAGTGGVDVTLTIEYTRLG